MLKIAGEENKEVYSGKTGDEVYLPEGSAIQSIDTGKAKVVLATTTAERIAFGKRTFESNCMACHQSDGSGIAGVFPPLAKSDFLNADKKRAIRAVTSGLSGKISVNGKEYNGVMPAQNLSDEDVANVLTFVYSSWGNSKQVVTPAQVRAARK